MKILKIEDSIQSFINWRGDFVDEPIQQVSVEEIHYPGLKPFECAFNSQLLHKKHPDNFDIVSGWCVDTTPQQYAKDKWGYIIYSHYWNYMRDEQIYVDATPKAQWIRTNKQIYLTDTIIFNYARWLDKLGLPDVSVVAPSYICDEQGDFIELEEEAEGMSRSTGNAILEGSLGHIFHKQCFVNGEWHPVLKKVMAE